MAWMTFYVALYAAVYALALDVVYGILQMAVVLSIPSCCNTTASAARPPAGTPS